MMSLKIEIPIHDEEGWTFPSPSEMPVRARLEASATCSPTSPEKLEKLKRAEDYACLLRQAHLEGVQARAARESQRAKEAQVRGWIKAFPAPRRGRPPALILAPGYLPPLRPFRLAW